MTPNAAKKIIAAKLADLHVDGCTLSAKTIGFSDLMRSDRLFVKIKGWRPNPAWNDLQQTAKENGFSITD